MDEISELSESDTIGKSAASIVLFIIFLNNSVFLVDWEIEPTVQSIGVEPVPFQTNSERRHEEYLEDEITWSQTYQRGKLSL